MDKVSYEGRLANILNWLKEYKDKTNCPGVVLGISGGKDSTVVAMLAKKIWGNNVVGVLMPNGFQQDLDDSLNIVSILNVRHCTINIAGSFGQLLNSIDNEFKLNKGCFGEEVTKVSEKSRTNVAPRIRMTTLYAIAQTLGYQVIGTGNLTESYLGWFTKWGDGAHDFNPIAHLTCSDVIEIGKILAREFNLPEKYIVKTPSDGLTGKSDEDNFGFTYDQVDNYINGNVDVIDSKVKDKIDKMHLSSEHKRYSIPNLNNTKFIDIGD